MKATILTAFVFAAFFSVGQKRVTAFTSYTYETNGDLLYIDSLQYTYNEQQIGIPHKKPVFTFDGIFHSYELRDDGLIAYTQANEITSYSNSSYPLAYQLTTTNLFTNGLVTHTSSGGNWRALSEYDAQGNLIKKTYEQNYSNIWAPIDSTTYTYDALGNQLTKSNYDVTTLDALVYTDTSWYVSGTNQLERFISYAPVVFGGSLEPNTQTIISYNGTQIVHEDHYLNTGVNGLEWTNRAVYSYNGGGSEPSEYALHTVVNNVVSPSPNDYTIFEQDAQNRHYRTLNITAAGDTFSILTFQYDQEFVTHTSSEMWNFDLVLYTDRETFYYYEDAPLSVDPLVEIEAEVYPNPATNVVYVSTPAQVNRIQLVNSNGQVLIEQQSPQLDVAHLAAGNYILMGFTDQGQFTKKIVKL